MKKIILLIAIALASCTTGDKHNAIVKDAKGDYYQLDWRVGVLYALQPINKAELDSLR